MTLVRVLPPDKYEHIMALKAQQPGERRPMKIAIGVAALIFISLLSPPAVAQPSERKSYTLRGTVEQVNMTHQAAHRRQ